MSAVKDTTNRKQSARDLTLLQLPWNAEKQLIEQAHVFVGKHEMGLNAAEQSLFSDGTWVSTIFAGSHDRSKLMRIVKPILHGILAVRNA
jgi:hypothetical protein